MSFKLTNYQKPKDIDTQAKKLPDWVLNGTPSTKTLYEIVLLEVENIKNRIATKGSVPIKERQLVFRQLAKQACLDPSLINKRRQPDLVRFIIKQNEKLGILWEQHHKTRQTGGSKLKRDELQLEVYSLRREVHELRELNAREAMECLLENELIENHRGLAKQVQDLKKENNDLCETVSNLRSRLKLY